MNTGVIFSGLLGSLIGVLITVGLYWYARYIFTKRALDDRLSFLLHDVHWDTSQQEVFQVWNATLKEVWAYYNAFLDFTPPIKRGRVRKAWEKYKGENPKTVKSLADQGTIVDSKLPPKNKDEFLHRIASFKKAI